MVRGGEAMSELALEMSGMVRERYASDPDKGLPAPVIQTLSSLDLGQVSTPIPVTGGLTLLKLVDKRQSGSSRTIDPDDPEPDVTPDGRRRAGIR